MSIPALTIPLREMILKYPYLEDFFISLGLKDYHVDLSCAEYVDQLSDGQIEDLGMDREQLISNYTEYFQKMAEIALRTTERVRSITIIGGRDKTGQAENLSFTMKTGDIICVVGPTGSGKSRLLADIECLAQRDTPTGRQILINDSVPNEDKRFTVEHKLIAQLSQNMNFIMDLTVQEFITMHAESRMIENVEETVQSVIVCANELAGEKFSLDTPVTSLSGGQSRALMIADTALLSSSPIVLIDEIENAGVDREKSLELLVKEEKIVLMSTHDPILALMGHKRMVIKNGGISQIVETCAQERSNLMLLQQFDGTMIRLRNMIRSGEKIDFDIKNLFGL
ncbi:ATP-binding cassette domain-containing protein [Desulfosporosinus sp. OT]|uniref:ATP-binding cassette domain-containing protein n=1 Tax=Desulfosporosinus sp. OT TaxID=913865 RepID=UPI000223ADF6|nr:ATP-binding cassette domain-containing protein [Desulfosporosinus sp. OT]EGW37550.1 ABC transporter family protein [Desulfosporosinus sp. OT]